ncbi:MAG: ImmA/IrrE family metallo-endopeptidase [Spirochaetes bacterium]|nr:ImmA/IrrE family metallo-endopeptidase [Spirochaetota bacterium]MBN2770826.1 ImmA/IrrE family metallo-endopeptidase [Spirochaetota bacterium]
MQPRIIKSEEMYEEALARIEELMDIPEGDPKEDELELLVLLVEKYEEEKYHIDLPDPIEAIKFRMEQMNLKKKDLVPYIGSQSKVSEVLNGKRPLSVTMMRSLHEGLGISAEVLLQKPGENLPEKMYNLKEYPFAEMFKRGYFSDNFKTLSAAKDQFEECLSSFFKLYRSLNPKFCLRQSDSKFGSETYLSAWQAHIINIISKESLVKYKKSLLNKVFLHELANLSFYNQGVLLVKEALNKIGIHFVVEKHLPKTHLDGACFYSSTGNPVIVLTLRYNRLDNFWFTLLHELAHLYLGHITSKENTVILDDTNKFDDLNEDENAANELAYQTFIPDKVWKKEYASIRKSERKIIELADELKISPAVIAGRIRWMENDYTIYTDLIGNREVKKHFDIV